MVSAAETPHRVAEHRTFVQAAADAGVEHLVYISFFGAAPTATFTLARDNWDTEQHIKASGMAYTFLRDNVYADLFLYLAGDDGVLRGPAWQGRVASGRNVCAISVELGLVCNTGRRSARAASPGELRVSDGTVRRRASGQIDAM
jgi:uncharacterized protein YbjT (DUF2867 family)